MDGRTDCLSDWLNDSSTWNSGLVSGSKAVGTHRNVSSWPGNTAETVIGDREAFEEDYIQLRVMTKNL